MVKEWIIEFTKRIKISSGSKKIKFSYLYAVNASDFNRTELDNLLIEYVNFIKENPLKKNDFYKYVNSYRDVRELNLKYFQHSVEKLKDYYKKVDANKKYSPFSEVKYYDYVLFMMLKLKGFYKREHDDVFNVTIKDHREYSPLSMIPSVFRGALPFKVKEYDMARAYPTFIDIELGIYEREVDVYRLIDKTVFNTLINMHHEVKSGSIDGVRGKLKPIYGARVYEVITDERFNNKGRMFQVMVIYEEKAIQEFIRVNKIGNYIRLHDGIFVLEGTTAEVVEFDNIKFTIKECVKPEINDAKKIFYTYDTDGLTTTPKQYADFFTQEKFIRGREENIDKLIIFQDTNNVVRPFNHKTKTVVYLRSEINELNTIELENRIAKESSSAIQQAYLLLPSKPIDYYTDTTFGLSFKNGFIKYDITNKIPSYKILSYSDVEGFFAPNRTQSHTFNSTEEESEFEIFLKMVSTGKNPDSEDLNEEDHATFNDFCAMFGYLCHTYKNRSFNPAIILSDDGANDLGRDGGRGKTILVNALTHVQPSILKGGNEFNPNYIHNFADLKSDKRIYITDDVPASFKYDALYTNIVGGISCQLKGREAIEIPFEKAPKFIITTNWAVQYDEKDTSTNRRFYEYKFTDFFYLTNTPIDIFEHNFFDEWDALEWDRFYNFVYTCVSTYLVDGLHRITYNKAEDNYRAKFSNDALLNEFEQIFNLLPPTFKVANFLDMYNAFDNNLRFEKIFHSRNIKKFIKIYIKHHNLLISYNKREREWNSGRVPDVAES